MSLENFGRDVVNWNKFMGKKWRHEEKGDDKL